MALAGRLGISKLVIGLTVVALGTIAARIGGQPARGVGRVHRPRGSANVVGSKIANIVLILGVAALISPINCTQRTLMRDGLIVLVVTVVFVIVGMTGGYDATFGLAAVLALVLYLGWSYVQDKAGRRRCPCPGGGGGGADPRPGLEGLGDRDRAGWSPS